MRALLALLLLALMAGCASALPPEPSFSKPVAACIVASQEQRNRFEGNLLPEHVKIVGEHSADEWKVIRDGYDKWIPMRKDQIRFVGCNGSDLVSIMRAR